MTVSSVTVGWKYMMALQFGDLLRASHVVRHQSTPESESADPSVRSYEQTHMSHRPTLHHRLPRKQMPVVCLQLDEEDCDHIYTEQKRNKSWRWSQMKLSDGQSYFLRWKKNSPLGGFVRTPLVMNEDVLLIWGQTAGFNLAGVWEIS